MLQSENLAQHKPYEAPLNLFGQSGIRRSIKHVGGTGLVRGINKWDLVAVVFNSVIGASIFGLPANAYSLANTYSLFALLACALLIGLIILCFAEMSSRFTTGGGPYQYAREVFGPVVGFEVGWLTWLTRLMGFAAVCNLFVTYLAHFSLFAADSAMTHGMLITCLVTSLTVINLIGVRETAVTNTVLAISKISLFLLFIVVGIFYIDPRNFSFAARPSPGAFSTAVMLLIFSFSGFEGAVIVAGEVRNPRRHYPVALLTVTGIVTALYILIQVVCIGTLPNLAQSQRPLADASSRFLFLGATGGTIISIGALVSIFGTLHAGLLGITRLPFAVAEQGPLPRVLAATHRRFNTPHVSILLSSGVILMLALTNSFISALQKAVITRLIIYAIACAGLPLLRRKKNVRRAAFTAPAGVAIAIVALLLCAWLLKNSSWREARDTGIAAALGLLLYAICKSRRAANNSEKADKPMPVGIENASV
jgi:basic amino acid/polyamine antiporter, APA family